MSARLRACLDQLRADRTLLILLGIAAVALVLRVVDLDARAMHHDESLHAKYAWDFSEGRGYTHNPLMHGPLLFHTVAGVFVVAGDSEVGVAAADGPRGGRAGARAAAAAPLARGHPV